MFAGDEAALAVAGVPVAEVGGFAIDAHGVVFFVPTHDAVVGYVAEEEASGIAEPDGAFTPAKACVEAVYGGVADGVFLEAGVDDFDGGVGVTDGGAVPGAGLPGRHVWAPFLEARLMIGLLISRVDFII